MENTQRKMIGYIYKGRPLPKFLDKFHIEDYQLIANHLPVTWFDFTDNRMDDATKIFATTEAKRLLQDYRRTFRRIWIPVITSSVLSVAAIIISIISLVLQL